MAAQRHDRIFPFSLLNAYPGSDCLDSTFWLPPAEGGTRRVWAMVPESAPVIAIDDAVLEPQHVCAGEPRWIDYGRQVLPTGFTQLRVSGMAARERADSHLVVTARADLSLEGCSLEEAERRLWGLARCDAGRTTLSPCRLTVGSAATFRVRYEAGPNGLPPGARVRFAVPKAFTRPQAEQPGTPGYTRIDHGPARIECIENSIEAHEKVDIFCRLDDGLHPGQAFDLSYSTDRTYIYPSSLHEVERRYWYSRLPPLSVAVALAGDAPFVSLAEGNGHCMEFVPGPAERLHLFLPGRRFSSEELVLRGTFTDHYRNVPPAEPIERDIELRLVCGEERIPLGRPLGRFVAPHRFAMPLPPLPTGVYRAEARRAGAGQLLARSNPMEIVEEGGDRRRIFWGEIHAHTEMSDGCGAYRELYRHARQEGCLDFAAAADHACYHSDNQWLRMQDVTNSWNEPGRFATLIGYEWAGRQVHRNIYTSRDRLDLFRGMYPPTADLDVVWRHFHGDEEVAAGPHGPLAHGVVWEHHDPSVERFVEVYSVWGAGDFRDNPLVPPFARDNPRGMTANELLRTGARLGFTGGGDCHEGHAGFSSEDPRGQGVTPHTFAACHFYRCGMTAAVTHGLDRPSLIAALHERSTYATTGARILLEFTAAGLPMGAVGQADEVECRAAVHGESPLTLLEIIKDGEVAWRRECDDLDATIQWRDPAPPSKEHYYYLHVVQADGQMAWSSPIWVSPAP